MKYIWNIRQYNLDDYSIIEFSDEDFIYNHEKVNIEDEVDITEKATFALVEGESKIYMYGILDGNCMKKWNKKPEYVSFFEWVILSKINKYKKVLEHNLINDNIHMLRSVDHSWRSFVEFKDNLNYVKKYCNRFGVQPDEVSDFLLVAKTSLMENDDIDKLRVSLDNLIKVIKLYKKSKQVTVEDKKNIKLLLDKFKIVICMLDGYVFVLSQGISIIEDKLREVASQYNFDLLKK